MTPPFPLPDRPRPVPAGNGETLRRRAGPRPGAVLPGLLLAFLLAALSTGCADARQARGAYLGGAAGANLPR